MRHLGTEPKTWPTPSRVIVTYWAKQEHKLVSDGQWCMASRNPVYARCDLVLVNPNVWQVMPMLRGMRMAKGRMVKKTAPTSICLPNFISNSCDWGAMNICRSSMPLSRWKCLNIVVSLSKKFIRVWFLIDDTFACSWIRAQLLDRGKDCRSVH